MTGALQRRLQVAVGVVEQRLGQPLAHVLLAPHARRAQHVDRHPRHDRRQVGLERRRPLVARVEAQPGLLHRILGLGDAAEDAVGDREEQRPQQLEPLGLTHAASSAKHCRHDAWLGGDGGPFLGFEA
jgi:hypothetical protein